MKLVVLGSAVALTLGLAACAPGPNPPMGGGTPSAGTPPISNAAGNSSGAPQSANSLPAGSRVNAPIAPTTGNVGTTRVGPR